MLIQFCRSFLIKIGIEVGNRVEVITGAAESISVSFTVVAAVLSLLTEETGIHPNSIKMIIYLHTPARLLKKKQY